MKPDIIRQPLLLAIASILVVIAAAMTTGTNYFTGSGNDDFHPAG